MYSPLFKNAACVAVRTCVSLSMHEKKKTGQMEARMKEHLIT